jgi:hypothetical protein
MVLELDVLAFQFPHPLPHLAISILKKWFIAPIWKEFHHKYKWYGSLCFLFLLECCPGWFPGCYQKEMSPQT